MCPEASPGGFNHNDAKYRQCCCHARTWTMVVACLEVAFVVCSFLALSFALVHTEEQLERGFHHLDRVRHSLHHFQLRPPQRRFHHRDSSESSEMMRAHGQDGAEVGGHHRRFHHGGEVEVEQWSRGFFIGPNEEGKIELMRIMRFLLVLGMMLCICLATVHILALQGAKFRRAAWLYPFLAVKSLATLGVGFITLVYLAAAITLDCRLYMCAAFNVAMLAYHFYAARGAFRCIRYIRDAAEEGRDAARATHYFHLPSTTLLPHTAAQANGAQVAQDNFNVFDPPPAPPGYEAAKEAQAQAEELPTKPTLPECSK